MAHVSKSKPPGGGLTDVQRAAIELLAEGLSDGQVGRRLGVPRNAVTKWGLYDAAFRIALAERRQSRQTEETQPPAVESDGPALDAAPPESAGGEPGATEAEPSPPPAEPAPAASDEAPKDAVEGKSQPMVTTRMASFS